MARQCALVVQGCNRARGEEEEEEVGHLGEWEPGGAWGGVRGCGGA